MFENDYTIEGNEEWQVPPAQTEPLPSGLIADEL